MTNRKKNAGTPAPEDLGDINYDHIPDITIDEETGREIKAKKVRIDATGRIIEEDTPSEDASHGGGGGESKKQDPPDGNKKEEKKEKANIFLTSIPNPNTIPDAKYPAEFDYESLGRDYPEIPEVEEITDLEITDDMYPSKTGFLPKYLNWACGTIDSPKAFHLASALSAVAFSLGRNYRAEFRHIAPNVMILLVGGSGDRKSSAMSLAKNLLPQDQVHAGSLASSGAFMQKLQSNPVMFWYADEADTFFQVVNSTNNTPSADIAARIATTFTGERSTYESLMQGNITVEDPCFTVLMGTALSWLKMRKLSPAFLRGGLFARMWIIPAKRERLLSFPPPPNKKTQEAIREWLAAIRGADDCVIPFSHAAKAELSAYQKYAQAPPILKECGVWSRSQAHIVKLSMLYHICQGHGPETAITGKTVAMAVNFVHNFLMPGYLWFINKLEAANDPVSEREQEIMERLSAAGSDGIKIAKLQASFGRRMNANEALVNLYRKERIVICKSLVGNKGHPSVRAVAAGKRIPSHYTKICELPAFIQRTLDMEE